MIYRRLFKFALFSRTLIIFLQFVFNICVPDHDADAFRLPHIIEEGAGNTITSFLLNGFSHWDAQYFLHIALYGYTHENTLAFFPLYPLALQKASSVLSYIIPSILSDLNHTLISGVILNVILFPFTTLFLYQLTLAIFHSEIVAYTSALLFSINPASVFFSSLYSESLFCFLTFGGLWALEKDNIVIALITLSLSSGVRSNGTLAAGFIVYSVFKQFINFKSASSRLSSKSAILIFFYAVKVVAYLIFFSIPFIAYQTYCYILYCTDTWSEPDVPDIVLDYVTRNDLKIPSEPSKWCYWKVPLSYSYVQSRYWDVGFLQYFTIKQIPNFILAFPIFLIIVLACIKYFSWNRSELWHLGLLSRQVEDSPDIYVCPRCFPYFCHILIVTVFSTFCIHIQVMTRMLCSSSPILYWISAMALLPSAQRIRFQLLKEYLQENGLISDLHFIKKLFLKSSISGKIIFVYFVSYFLIGIFLHVNFFPWT